MRQLIILDRDGVINQDSAQYIKSVNEFIFLPGSIEAIALLTQFGYQVAVATNQSGLARGYFSEQELNLIHEKMLSVVQAAGGAIAAIEYCGHLPNAGCFCRKPNPGMLYALAKKFNYPLNKMSFIGDKLSDIQAAIAAGVRPVLVVSQMSEITSLKYPSVPIFSSLLEYVQNLIG